MAIRRTAEFGVNVCVERMAGGPVVQVAVNHGPQHWAAISVPKGLWGKFTSKLLSTRV